MSILTVEVGRFRTWADGYPAARRSGEWECDYEAWPALYDAVLGFVARQPFEAWSEADLRDVLYAIARDNETQHLAREIRERHPELLPPLVRAAMAQGERDDRWQLAVELGHAGGADAEALLLELAADPHEYVRRMALQSLTHLRSPAAERLALEAWHRPGPDQEWARMMALWSLNELESPRLASLLEDAERDERQYLRGYAERMRRGDPIG